MLRIVGARSITHKVERDVIAGPLIGAPFRVRSHPVNKLAAATYMGGRIDGMEAMLTAESPQGLIDTMAVQRVMATQMSTQMASFRVAGDQAAKAEQASAKSAADAKSAAEQAAAVRASQPAAAYAPSRSRISGSWRGPDTSTAIR